MRLLRLDCLRQGEPLLATDGRCPPPAAPLLAVGMAVAILAISLIAAQALVSAAASIGATNSLPGPTATVLFLVGMQATMIMLTLTAARFDGRNISARLAMAPSPMGGRALAEAVAAAIALVALYTAFVYTTGLTDIVTDLRPFIGLMQAPIWPLAVLAVAVGAPISEELLFRGYLLPALARSRFGINGAALLSTVAWTGLHAGYSAAGMLEVFLIGLYFCWLTWRSGSLRLALACHVTINTLTLGLIALLPVAR